MLSDQPRLLPPPPSIHHYHARSFTLSLFRLPAVSRCFVLIIRFIICLVHATALYFTDWITTGHSHYSWVRLNSWRWYGPSPFNQWLIDVEIGSETTLLLGWPAFPGTGECYPCPYPCPLAAPACLPPPSHHRSSTDRLTQHGWQPLLIPAPASSLCISHLCSQAVPSPFPSYLCPAHTYPYVIMALPSFCLHISFLYN